MHEPHESHMRTYTAEERLLYYTRIRNLGKEPVRLSPVYYHKSAATGATADDGDRRMRRSRENCSGAPNEKSECSRCFGAPNEEAECQETITLQPGELRDMAFPVQIDLASGEIETGWKFFENRDESADGDPVVLHIRLVDGTAR